MTAESVAPGGRTMAEILLERNQLKLERDTLRVIVASRGQMAVGAFIDGLAAFMSGVRDGEPEAISTVMRLVDLMQQAVTVAQARGGRGTGLYVPKGNHRQGGEN